MMVAAENQAVASTHPPHLAWAAKVENGLCTLAGKADSHLLLFTHRFAYCQILLLTHKAKRISHLHWLTKPIMRSLYGSSVCFSSGTCSMLLATYST